MSSVAWLLLSVMMTITMMKNKDQLLIVDLVVGTIRFGLI